MSPRLALANLIVQILLIVGVGIGAYIARRRRFLRHCLLMRLLVAAQIVAIAAIMGPSLARYVGSWSGWSWFTAELVAHHVLGVIVVALFIYINLAFLGVVRSPRRLRPFMWTALGFWVLSLAPGIHLYWYIWR